MSDQETITLSVQGMSCQGCVRSVTNIISKATGAAREDVHVSLEEASARFEVAPGTTLDALLERLTRQGFEATQVER